jgi:hypothetical protein
LIWNDRRYSHFGYPNAARWHGKRDWDQQIPNVQAQNVETNDELGFFDLFLSNQQDYHRHNNHQKYDCRDYACCWLNILNIKLLCAHNRFSP